ncbi:metal ABC transporter permease [Desulforegula conservatrix]|uniref:metal ABC transporter permease n=1 Tax=Desulforegula conservatrix TaxID=153026 RepID=UPI00041D5233|nr:metal ABC transporter permease [Desulforegula conservatrix]
MMEALGFEFMRNAIMAGLLASLACGIIGSLVVAKRIVFISGGIAHAAYGGIGIAFFFGLPYMVGTLGFSLVVAIVMTFLTLDNKHRADTVIGVLWAAGMALGVVLIDLTPGYNVDLMSYLFGSILAVTPDDLYMMSLMCLIIIFMVVFFYNDFLAMSYDPDFARLRRIPVRLLYAILLVMIAVSIVMVIKVVGLILVIALMTIPPYMAEKKSVSLGQMMVISSILSAVFTLGGLWISYAFDITSGAAIILFASAAFAVFFIKEKGKV